MKVAGSVGSYGARAAGMGCDSLGSLAGIVEENHLCQGVIVDDGEGETGGCLLEESSEQVGWDVA